MLTFSKKIVRILTTFAILFILIVNNSFALVKQSEEFFVNDTANILNSNTEKYIINMNRNLEAQTGAQIVVVTVTSLNGLEIEDYATQLFRQYDIGDKSKNNGILFLVSTDERRVRIEVGYGLEGRINDGKAGRILDNYVVPYLKNNNWNEGIKNGFNAILEEVSQEYNITIVGSNSPVSIVNDSLDIKFIYFTIIPLLLINAIARFKLIGILRKFIFATRNSCSYNSITMCN